MIEQVHLQRFKCFKDCRVDLGPFTVLIGPNGSGKSAFLHGIQLAEENCHWVFGHGRRALNDACFYRGVRTADWQIAVALTDSGRSTNMMLRCYESQQPSLLIGEANVRAEHLQERVPECLAVFAPVAYYCFAPSDLRQPSAVSGGAPQMTPSGLGFPSFLEDFLRADRKAFDRMEDAFRARFPDLRISLPKEQRRDVGPIPVEQWNNVLRFPSEGKLELGADEVSDGAMLYLAFLAVCHQPNPPKTLMIEEPENGVHYKALKEIVEVLRSFGSERGVQIILTTHSPYLPDFVEPEEVRIFEKDSEGAVTCRKMSDIPEVDHWRKHFNAGELWTNLVDQKPETASEPA